MRGSDIIIIGAGIVGCACAYELARAGASVTLLEYGRTGMQATNAAAGMLAPLTEAHGPGPMLELGLRALLGYPRLVEELEAQTGFELEYRESGVLRVALSMTERDELAGRSVWLREHTGMDLAWLDADAVREAEPRVTPRAVGGFFSSCEGHISNQLLTLALARAATSHGAVLRETSPVVNFERRGTRVSGVVTRDERLAADRFVLAAGARSAELAARLGLMLPVRPIRGQMIALGGMLTPIRSIVWGPDGYLVPRANGLIFAGATVEDVGFRRRTTKAGTARMRSMSRRLVPQLNAATMHFAWAGLRPATPDGLPVIGPMQGCENVVAATGHYRNGILLGPITGQLIATGMLDDDWSHVAPVFSPARFDAKLQDMESNELEIDLA